MNVAKETAVWAALARDHRGDVFAAAHHRVIQMVRQAVGVD
jgi:hypothetical protein